jgi:hypothetical protein
MMIKILMIIVLLTLQGCATIAASDSSSRLSDPHLELNNFSQIELNKNENDININGVNYHLFSSKEVLQDKAAFVIIPYDSPPPRWNTSCKILDDLKAGELVQSKEITWAALLYRSGEIYIHDNSFKGHKCIAVIDVGWSKRSRTLYALSAFSLHLLALPIDLLTFPIQIAFSDKLNPF